MEFPNIQISKETFSKLFDRVIKGLVPITQEYINTDIVKSSPTIKITKRKKRKRTGKKKSKIDKSDKVKVGVRLNTNLV